MFVMEIACVLIPEAVRSAKRRPGAVGEASLEAAELTERVVRGLEEIGAAVECERPGEAYFAVDGLRGIHGGQTEGVLSAARRAAGATVGVAAAPTRFAAWAAASGERRPLSALPVRALADRLGLPERPAADLVEAMARLGIGTLGALASLSAAEAADRFGPAGLRARRIARGEEEPLRPRAPHEELAEEIELPEGTAGHLLERAVELLVDRLLAAPRRRGRTLLGLRLGARLSGGGSWSVEQGLGRPTASARVIRSLLVPHLESLPAPALSLRLRALGLGPRAGDQMELTIRGEEPRRRRLGAAVRELRAAQGGDSLLKVLPIDPDSRVPERRSILTPYPEP